jgi:hypothetical protein
VITTAGERRRSAAPIRFMSDWRPTASPASAASRNMVVSRAAGGSIGFVVVVVTIDTLTMCRMVAQ